MWLIRIISVLSLLTLLSCASAQRHTYQPGILSSDKSYAVIFTYDMGQEETHINQVGIERRYIKQGQPERYLALRDNVKFGLRDAGVKIIPETASPNVTIQIHPTIRQANCEITCGSFDTLSVIFFNSAQPEEPIARIHIRNGDRVATTMRDSEFANYATKEILKIIAQSALRADFSTSLS